MGEQAECVVLAGSFTIPSTSVRLLAAIRSTSVGLLAAARAQNRAAASQDGAAAAQEGRRGGGIGWFDSGEEEIVGELGGGGRHTQVHQVGRLLSALRPVIGRRGKLSEPIGMLDVTYSAGKEKSRKQCALIFQPSKMSISKRNKYMHKQHNRQQNKLYLAKHSYPIILLQDNM